MASNYEVVRRFVERGRPLKGFSVHADSKYVYSYGPHFPMAYADDGRKIFIINGDYWGVTTSRHQGMVRGAVRSQPEWKKILIPYSVLGAARVNRETITLVEEGIEISKGICDTCNIEWNLNRTDPNSNIGPRLLNSVFDYEQHWSTFHKTHKMRVVHLLAPALIMSDDKRYFLSGFDSTARAWNGGYFFSELPHRVKTIDEAFLSLRPKTVKDAEKNNTPVKRQGDIFAIPDPRMTTRKLHKIGKPLPERVVEEKVLLDWNNNPFYTEQVVTDRLANPNQVSFIANGYRQQLLGTNHYATEVVEIERRGKPEVWARGVLYHRPTFREADHRNIKLGKLWHRIFRNTAIASWSAANGRSRVD